MTRTLTILLLLTLNLAFTQNFKFGKVTEEELLETHHPIDSSAEAAFLYKYRKSYFKYNQEKGFLIVTDVHERIKIYNSRGFKYATRSINLYRKANSIEKLFGLKAYTYNIENGKVVDAKLKNDGVFEEEASDFLNRTKLTMPNINEGSIIELKYSIESPFISNIDEFRFQETIPINRVDYSFHVPEYFNYKTNVQGYLDISSTKEYGEESIIVESKSTPKQGGVIEKYKSNYTYKVIIDNYLLDDLPAVKDEPYVDNISNYFSAIKYELAFTQFPNSVVDNYAVSWDDVIRTIYENDNFGDELHKSGYFEDEIDNLLLDAKNEDERISKIFNYVKSNVKWNGIYGKYTNQGVEKAFQNKTGNVSEINLMLCSMLRYAGVKANPVLISTRSNGKPLFPTLNGYNYVISCIENNENVILLDATSEFSLPNILPVRALNWEGRIIRERGSSAAINLYSNEKTIKSTNLSVELNENGIINGTCRVIRTGQGALLHRESFNNITKESYSTKLENDFQGLNIVELDIKNTNEISKPIIETYKFNIDSEAELIGDYIYLSPMMFLKLQENPFKLEDRKYPINFSYPSNTKYIINIKTPKGYIVESRPEPKSISLPDDLGYFKFNIVANDFEIQVVAEIDLNAAIVPAIYYQSIKEFYKLIIEKETEKVVLKKG